jgi:chromosome segregation ATPase
MADSSDPDAKKQLAMLDEIIVSLKAQIEAERAQIKALKEQGSDIATVLRADMNAAWKEMEGIETQIEDAKDQASSRKDEISGWKLWYNSLAEIDKTESMKKLEFEVGWRSLEIGEIEKKIASLQESQLAARGRQEAARQKLEAYEAGGYGLPIEEDPRIKELQEQIMNLPGASKE